MHNGMGIDDLLSPLKQRLHMLEAENKQLITQLQQAQQELAELKRGVGITVMIAGKPVPTGVGAPLDVQPTSAPGGYNRAFATPVALNERRPPDVVPLSPAPGGYPAIARQSNDATNHHQRGGDLAKHFLED